MKKPLNNEALLKEASLWSGLKKAMKEEPVKTCHK